MKEEKEKHELDSNPSFLCPLKSVRSTCYRLFERESRRKERINSISRDNNHNVSQVKSEIDSITDIVPVWIDDSAIEIELKCHPSLYQLSVLPPSWAQWYHYSAQDYTPATTHSNSTSDFLTQNGIRLTCQYILVLDALNFCFWPLSEYEYSNLASSLKQVIINDQEAFKAENLKSLTQERLNRWLQPISQQQEQIMKQKSKQFSPTTITTSSSFSLNDDKSFSIPLLSERTRALNELGSVLIEEFSGECFNLISSSSRSASRLVKLITQYFSLFRDSCIDPRSGEQIFLYKRAQIFVADVWGAFGGAGVGEFHDIDQLTCFPDYRLPQLLRANNILNYSVELLEMIDKKELIPAGSFEEISIRAHTVIAVDKICSQLQSQGIKIIPIQVDWILWERGEAMKELLPSHHRTLTPFY